MHDKLSKIVQSHANGIPNDLFADCPASFQITRYHSLVVGETTISVCLAVTASNEAGAIMALSHRTHDLQGVQFHLESIASVAGYRLLAAFLRACGHDTPSETAVAALEAQALRLDERFPGQTHP